MKIILSVHAEVDEQEVEKLNRRAARVGRAAVSAEDRILAQVDDALRHSIVVARHRVALSEVKP